MTEGQKERFLSYIDKAFKRAEWYSITYKGANNFHKMRNKNFWKTLQKCLNKVQVNEEAKAFLRDAVPEEFRSSDKSGVVYEV